MYDPERMRWFKRQQCTLWSHANHVCQPGTVEGHHVHTVGAGGTDDALIPLCRKAHRDVHRMGRHTFECLYGLDLEALAREWAERWHNLQREAG